MQEHQVTVGGETHSLSDLFIVMATQNPLEQAGTYPLPEAQLDRFLLHVTLDYPSAEEELSILKRDQQQHFGADKPSDTSPIKPAIRTGVQTESPRGLEPARGDPDDRNRSGFFPNALLNLVCSGLDRASELCRG